MGRIFALQTCGSEFALEAPCSKLVLALPSVNPGAQRERWKDSYACDERSVSESASFSERPCPE